MTRTDKTIIIETLSALVCCLRTFRNVPKEEQDWTSLDDDALEQGFALLDTLRSQQ